MAYEITFIEGEKRIVGHSLVNQKIKLISPIFTLNTSRMNNASFTILPDNPAYYFISEMMTELSLANEDGEVEFEGRVLNRTGKSGASTERTYKVEDVLGYLHDTRMMVLEFKGSPLDLFKKIIERHNDLGEPKKQFDVGICEVDVFKEYVSEGSTGTNVTLAAGDKATIKATAQHIYSTSNGATLNMANSVKGVAHTVETGTSLTNGKYLLRHPIPAWGISGWVKAEDIVEVYTTTETTGATTSTGNGYPANTQVRIKKGVETYYRGSDGSGAKTIPTNLNGLNYRELNYTTRTYSEKYKRYSIVYKGEVVAWVNEADLDFGNVAKPSQPYDNSRPDYVERQRVIEAELTYNMSAWDAIDQFLLEPYGAEITWEYIEGVRTINIYDRIENETTEEIRPSLNLIAMQESLDPRDVVTVVLPVGRLAKTDE